MFDITFTAQALEQLQALHATASWGMILLAGIIGLLGGPVGQNIIEHLTSGPKFTPLMKALTPTVLASILAAVSTHFGVTPAEATTAAAAFASMAHVWNVTPMAAVTDKPDNVPAVSTGEQGAPVGGAKP